MELVHSGEGCDNYDYSSLKCIEETNSSIFLQRLEPEVIPREFKSDLSYLSEFNYLTTGNSLTSSGKISSSLKTFVSKIIKYARKINKFIHEFFTYAFLKISNFTGSTY